MQTDPKTVVSSLPDDMKFAHESGLQMLNDLFTNEKLSSLFLTI